MLENPKTIFYGLVEQTGVEGAAELTDLARQVCDHQINWYGKRQKVMYFYNVFF